MQGVLKRSKVSGKNQVIVVYEGLPLLSQISKYRFLNPKLNRYYSFLLIIIMRIYIGSAIT
jgi:hypothetical protein